MRVLAVLLLVWNCVSASSPVLAQEFPSGWQATSPRDEIRPDFAYHPKGGPSQNGSWVIEAGPRPGMQGAWEKTFAITGGDHYAFRACYKTDRVAVPRRSVVPRFLWRNDANQVVRADAPEGMDPNRAPSAEPNYPIETTVDARGWNVITGTFRAPTAARQAILQLQFFPSPEGRIEWAEISFEKVSPPASRKVRLASVHYMPRGGKSARDNCEQYAPWIAQAATQKADLVVLGETITMVNNGHKYADVAESIPGPSTDYFGGLSKQHQLCIAVGLVERDGPLIYNVCVLLGPDGKMIGKYRKVCLPRGEVEAGVTPGTKYPVFNAPFGKVGMMVCYDGFFPEVARQLTANGAEVIAFPVWGCNPLLAAARACENHTYVVSSTFSPIENNWMQTAVYGHDGKPLALATKEGQLIIAEVDLGKAFYWQNNLGDFRNEVQRTRPVSNPEPAFPASKPTSESKAAGGQ